MHGRLFDPLVLPREWRSRYSRRMRTAGDHVAVPSANALGSRTGMSRAEMLRTWATWAEAGLAVARHAQSRRTSFTLTLSRLLDVDDSLPRDVMFTHITPKAIRAFQTEWEPTASRSVGWDWEDLRQSYGKSPARFGLAIWAGERLCGLAIGRLSPAKTIVSVHYVEGSPVAHPLKNRVLYLTAQVGTVMGAIYGSERLRFANPAPHTQNRLASQGSTMWRGRKMRLMLIAKGCSHEPQRFAAAGRAPT